MGSPLTGGQCFHGVFVHTIYQNGIRDRQFASLFSNHQQDIFSINRISSFFSFAG